MTGRRIPAWLPSAGVAAALVGLVAWSFAQRWAVLSASPFPLGVDGYFYPIQLRSLLETGHLQYPASPLSFWLCTPLAAATDPITGAKLGAALFTALVALPAYGVGARLGNGRGPGLVAAAFATFSAGSAYMTIEFVKNGIGLTVALTALWLVLRALETPNRPRIIAALVAIVAALLAHKMAAAIVVGIAVPAAIAEATHRGALRGRRLLYVLVAVAIVTGTAIVIGGLAPHRFLSTADLELVRSTWTADADWSLPALDGDRLGLGAEPLVGLVLALGAAVALLAEQAWWRARIDVIGRCLIVIGIAAAVVGASLLAIALGGVAVLAGALALGAARRLAPQARPANLSSPGVSVVAWLIVALGLVIGLPWLAVDDAQGLGMRLRIVAFVPMALCAAIVLRSVLRVVLPLLAVRHERVANDAVCVVLALLVAQRVPGSRTEGLVPMHPALVTAAQSLAGRIPEGDTVIVPERHLIFMVAWYTRAKISIRPEPVPIDRRWRLMPRAFVVHDSVLDHALLAVRDRRELPRPLGLHPRDPNGLVLVAEVTWQYVLSTLPPSARRHWGSWQSL